jgi:hypothetical protein
LVFFVEGFCANALPAAAFESLLVRPSRNTLDAAVAAEAEVTFFGALVCDNALAATVLDFDAVLVLVIVFDALVATFELVTFPFVMMISFSKLYPHSHNITGAPPIRVLPPKKFNDIPFSFFLFLP